MLRQARHDSSAIAVPLLAWAAALFGLVGARRTPGVREVEVPIDGLPAALHGFTIAQISDLHVGQTVKAPYVRAVVERVNALQADAVADYSARHFDASHRSDPSAALAGAPRDVAGLVLRVLLAHQPRSAPAAADAGFHVQLSGHTHGASSGPGICW